MAKWHSENPEYSQISEKDYITRCKIEAAIAEYTREMDGYSYCGTNPGVSEEDYDDVAESIMTTLDLWENQND